MKVSRCTNAVFCKTRRVPEDGWETCPAGGRGTHSVRVGSWLSRPRSGTESSGVVLPTFVRVVLLCFAARSLQIAVERPLQALFARMSRSSFADRAVMVASRLLGAAAACAILLSFAAGHCKSYWNGRAKVAIVISQFWQ